MIITLYAAARFEVWSVYARVESVPSRWDALMREIETEPWRFMFEGKRLSQLKSHFNALLANKRQYNADAETSERAGEPVPPLEGNEALLVRGTPAHPHSNARTLNSTLYTSLTPLACCSALWLTHAV